MSERRALLMSQGEWRLAAELALREGDPAAAQALYERLMDYRQAGVVALERGRLIEALEFFLKAPAMDAAEKVRQRLMADLDQRVEDAARCFASYGHHLQAAELEASIGRAREAVAHYKEARFYGEAARLLERIGSWQEAGSLYEKELEGGARAGHSWLGFGRALQHFEDHERAADALAKAVEVLGDGHGAREARLRWAYSLSAMRLHESALQLLQGEWRSVEPFLKWAKGAFGGAGLGDRFQVQGPHGGAFPLAYEAWDVMRREEVIVQVLSGEVREREAYIQGLRALSDPPLSGILPLVDVDERLRFLTLVKPGGSPLATLKRVYTAPQAAMVGRQVLKALQGAHRRGVLHGRLDPWCVYLMPGFGIAVAGFGLICGGEEGETETQDDGGELAFLAPEVVIGRSPELGTDFFGVGALLWWMLKEEAPQPGAKEGEGALGLLAPLLEPELSRRPGTHQEVEQILTKLGGAQGPLVSYKDSLVEKPREVERYQFLSLLPDGGGIYEDRWLSRRVLRYHRKAEEEVLRRLRAFAVAGAGLQRVLKVEVVGEEVWVEIAKPPELRLEEAIAASPVTRRVRWLREIASTFALLARAGVALGEGGEVWLDGPRGRPLIGIEGRLWSLRGGQVTDLSWLIGACRAWAPQALAEACSLRNTAQEVGTLLEEWLFAARASCAVDGMNEAMQALRRVST